MTFRVSNYYDGVGGEGGAGVLQPQSYGVGAMRSPDNWKFQRACTAMRGSLNEQGRFIKL